MNQFPKTIEKEDLATFKHASVYRLAGQPTAVVEATANYIPIDQFKEVFSHIGDLIKQHKVTTLIFDKRNLTVFHQPSMEWYFVEWKAKMAALGLTNHVKILPTDRIFRESVKIGREKINKAYPNGTFHTLNIRYAESIEEAITL